MVMRNWLKLQPLGRTLTAYSSGGSRPSDKGGGLQKIFCWPKNKGAGAGPGAGAEAGLLGPSTRSATVQGMCHFEGYMCVVQCKVPLPRLPLKILQMN